MSPRLSRYVPDSLAGRFALLLVAALVAANAVAFAVLWAERQRLDRSAREGQEIERIASLVPGLDALDPERRRTVARAASTRFADVSVGATPVVESTAPDARAAALAARLTAALGEREVRVAMLETGPIRDRPGGGRRDAPGDDRRADRRDARHDGRGGGPARDGRMLAISIALAGPGEVDGAPDWLSVVTRGAGRRGDDLEEEVFFVILGLSLVAAVGVSLVFVRRLVRPLGAMAEAARAAGRGDRSVRVAETGARELRDAAAAFNDMQARIARFDAERVRTLAAVGHDLRTPITSLRIRAEMLDDEAREPMVRTLDEMGVMAAGLVAWARGEGDGETTASVDLAPLLERLCAERGAAFEAVDDVAVAGRPVALTRAIGNLVDNAVRYGGAARVRLSRDARGALVTVDDDGPGIAPERLDTVFEPFVRGEASRSVETGGAGLGLSIARSIVRAHGGEVELANRPAGGLRARVSLPLEGGGTTHRDRTHRGAGAATQRSSSR